MDQSLVQSLDQEARKRQLQVQSVRESFAERYADFLESLDEFNDSYALSADDESSLLSLMDETEADPAVRQLQEEGHGHVASGMSLQPTAHGRATSLHWQVPAPHSVQAGIFIPVSLFCCGCASEVVARDPIIIVERIIGIGVLLSFSSV